MSFLSFCRYVLPSVCNKQIRLFIEDATSIVLSIDTSPYMSIDFMAIVLFDQENRSILLGMQMLTGKTSELLYEGFKNLVEEQLGNMNTLLQKVFAISSDSDKT